MGKIDWLGLVGVGALVFVAGCAGEASPGEREPEPHEGAVLDCELVLGDGTVARAWSDALPLVSFEFDGHEFAAEGELIGTVESATVEFQLFDPARLVRLEVMPLPPRQPSMSVRLGGTLQAVGGCL